MKLQLYYAPVACSLVPYLTLTEAGADFEVLPVNMGKGQHNTPDYLRLNPKHKVPVLVIDGEPLTENVAIQIWIARNFPQAKLLPADPMKEVKAISIMAWCASGIHPALTPNANPKRYCDLPGTEDNVKQCAQKLLVENFTVADDMLAGREWFFDHFTAADAYFSNWTCRRFQIAWRTMSGCRSAPASKN
jgi:glutathione S-transferase